MMNSLSKMMPSEMMKDVICRCGVVSSSMAQNQMPLLPCEIRSLWGSLGSPEISWE